MDESIRRKILSLLDEPRIKTIAMLGPDGWPRATTVGYVSEGFSLHFLCGLDSQKAANLARDDRASLTIDHDPPDIMAITGLSLAAWRRFSEGNRRHTWPRSPRLVQRPQRLPGRSHWFDRSQIMAAHCECGF
jgi:hypothetical protein